MRHSVSSSNKAVVENPSFALAPLAAAISFALTAAASPMVASAQGAPSGEPQQLRKIVAQNEDGEEQIKKDTVESPKFTQPLLDTPQTITVVTKEVLRQQGAGTLIEALANTPGITLQLGENGNTSAGDTFSMRGSASQTNVFVDGMRDLGAITRDIFNTDQVEIAKGAVGADYGRGATAGYINLVSKKPQLADSSSASLRADTGVTLRATGDVNKQLSDSTAIRVNAVWQDGDVIGRDLIENNRWGVAPAVAIGLGTATRFYLYSQHLRADNVPDGGIPSIGLPGFYNATIAGATPPSVDRNNYYGRFDDFEDMKSDMATFRVEHDFSDTLRLSNSTRYGKSEIERVLTGINALCFRALAADQVTCATTGAILPTNQWTIARTRQSIFQENKLLTNQTNLVFSFDTGSVRHDIASGVEYIKESQFSPTYTGLGTLPNANLYSPNPRDAFTVPYALARTAAFSDGETQTIAAYVFDSLKVTDAWLFTGGVRLDNYDTDFKGTVLSTAAAYPTLPVGTPVALSLSDSDTLISWKLGVVFKPISIGSIYLSYSDSSTPPGGTNFVLSDPNAANNTTNINRPGLDPQEATNLEIGTKWDLLDARLALSLALYRTENRNEVSVTDAATREVSAFGKRRVQGAEFGVVGKITDNWQVIAGLAWSDNEVLSGSTGNNAAGAAARWAPEYSGNLWTTYSLGRWTTGFGANYSSEQKRIVDPTQAGVPATVPEIPGYVVFNGMAGVVVTDWLNLQLNIYNLTDKEYISSLNNSGARLRLGVERYAQLTASLKF